MNPAVPKLIKKHGVTNNSTIYTPVFVSKSARETNLNDTGVGYYTDTWYGIHNPGDTAQTVTVWTVEQGTDGDGASVKINPGDTFYCVFSKITVAADVVLLGIPTTFSR
jgi:hypothetical protein